MATREIKQIKVFSETKQRWDDVKPLMSADLRVMLTNDEMANRLLDLYFQCRNKKETQKP